MSHDQALPLKAEAPHHHGSGTHATKDFGQHHIKRKPRRLPKKRSVLLAIGPLIAIALGTEAYLTGGRWVSSDNSYVQADMLAVTTDVAGTVVDIAVKENQHVKAGDLLFKLDDEPYRIAVAGATADLGIVRDAIQTDVADYRAALSKIEEARTDVGYYETTWRRQRDLNRSGNASQAALDQAKRNLDAANDAVAVAQREADATLARLGGNADQPVEDNPRYRTAAATLDKAERDLRHTVITAPMDGTVTNVPHLQVGAYLDVADPAFSLVASDHLWVSANLKETDLTFLKVGDVADVSIDSYPGQEWKGKVTSLSPATGAQFSVLPAQNASGNWVKVVQRVPVRIELELPADAPQLRAGMSAIVEIDTGHQRTFGGLIDSIEHLL
ncbi:HlyD family secretion protein [Radicibacter daui]|uniref:HlyD family secretion protein n=1 Tax=Radicibacter daui TaxID=3064829 RepID=UPI004046D3EF